MRQSEEARYVRYDILAERYGWTIDYIDSLPMNAVISVINTIKMVEKKREQHARSESKRARMR